MAEYPRSERSTVRRQPNRATYDEETVHAIIDEALICHVAFAVDGQPFVIPTLHARVGDEVVLHGSNASRLIRAVASGERVCIAFTLVDGLVLARSAFHHSANYRSAVVFGTGRLVADPAEKVRCMEAITNHVMPGRWAEVRPVAENELAATSAVAVRIEEASAKARTGPPVDDEDDYALPIWAGVIPLKTTAGDPIPDERLAADLPVPVSVREDARWR